MGQKAADIATIGRISAVPAMLKVISDMTGLRFAAVARVTDDTWTACAVLDQLDFGLGVGGELDLTTTICHEIRGSHVSVVIDKASEDPLYHDHHTPRLYQFESYISVPVFRTDGRFFGPAWRPAADARLRHRRRTAPAPGDCRGRRDVAIGSASRSKSSSGNRYSGDLVGGRFFGRQGDADQGQTLHTGSRVLSPWLHPPATAREAPGR